MPIHNIIVNNQFKPIPVLLSQFKDNTLMQHLIVIDELNILLAHERVHLGHPHFVLPEQEPRGGKIWYPPSCLSVGSPRDAPSPCEESSGEIPGTSWQSFL